MSEAVLARRDYYKTDHDLKTTYSSRKEEIYYTKANEPVHPTLDISDC